MCSPSCTPFGEHTNVVGLSDGQFVHRTVRRPRASSYVVDLVGEAGVPESVNNTTAEVGGDDDVQSAAGGVGGHLANGLASLFIACGQDEANAAGSHATLINTTLLQDDSLRISVTIPSLIVATYGGGTGMATQQGCPAILDCDGPGNMNKFAEIAAATVLAGEISLGSAISASDWATSHESLGRNG